MNALKVVLYVVANFRAFTYPPGQRRYIIYVNKHHQIITTEKSKLHPTCSRGRAFYGY